MRGISDRRITINSLSDYRTTFLRCSDFRIHKLVKEMDFCLYNIVGDRNVSRIRNLKFLYETNQFFAEIVENLKGQNVNL